MSHSRLALFSLLPLLFAGCASSDFVEMRDPATFYLRGAFVGWATDDSYRFSEQGDGKFTAEATLSATGKPHYLKLADEEWRSGANCGPLRSPTDETLELNQPVEVSCNEPRRSFKFTPATDGRYRFVFDTSGEVPTLTVVRG